MSPEQQEALEPQGVPGPWHAPVEPALPVPMAVPLVEVVPPVVGDVRDPDEEPVLEVTGEAVEDDEAAEDVETVVATLGVQRPPTQSSNAEHAVHEVP